jgi:hypothetical protein
LILKLLGVDCVYKLTAMAELKTKQTETTVNSYLDTVADETVRKDCQTIIYLMEKITGMPAKMWGTAIVGFGSYHYKYASGHEGDMCLIGFSPRKADITLYVLCGFDGQDNLLGKLGKYKAKGGCLHIKKLTDVDMEVLESLIKKAFKLKKQVHLNN